MPVHLSNEYKPVVCEVRYDFRKSNANPSMLEILQSIVQTFTNILNDVIDRHVPKKRVLNARVPWQTSELRRVKAAKRSALKQYAKHRTLPLLNYRVIYVYTQKSEVKFCTRQQNLMVR